MHIFNLVLSASPVSKMKNTIYLIRHGQTTWNRAGRLQGQADSPLTLLGTQQVEAIGKKLKAIIEKKKYYFWSSPLGRTKQTTSIICDEINFKYDDVLFDERLVEITLGDRDGYKSWKALFEDFPEDMARREKDPWNFSHPNGESSQMVLERVKPFIEKIVNLEGIHLVVTHGVVSKIIRGTYLNLSHEEIFSLDRPQDGFHKLQDGKVEKIELSLG